MAQPRVQTVGELLAELADGRLRVERDRTGAPEWPEHRKRLLLDSVLRGWPVGPLYALVTAEGPRTVVDGGQRLRTLQEFVSGALDVDGRLTPTDDLLRDIDGKTYPELPTGLRSAFDDYPVVVIEFQGLAPEEVRPALFRLNDADQLSYTQRSVLESGAFGEQVRELTLKAADWGLTHERIGFSNATLAYEDVLGRVIIAVERRDVKAAGSDSTSLTGRLKDGYPTPPDVYEDVSTALRSLITRPEIDEPAIRFSKASLVSWLLLVVRAQRQFGLGVEHYAGYLMEWLEPQRRRLAAGLDLDARPPTRDALITDLPAVELLSIFNERAAVEAMTGDSTRVRDAILWLFFVAVGGAPTPASPPVPQVLELYDRMREGVDLEASLAAAVRAKEWGRWE
ncbi:DUF262 domain-containing protein [Kibdelosporangium persicum]|uniref:DUF262 domain-containing protein n=1 Tax=Kibdelosporangium persicum TaxID=2698649 RepID=UPI001563E3D8|nr:DUF262 domain-containing protein [Kibdelosporangium persicum]